MTKFPLDKKRLEELAAKRPTPFYIYDERGIADNARRLKEAFSWNPGFREHFAVKAAPNPEFLKIFGSFGFGADCSSMAELELARAAGITGPKIMFTSNDTPAEEFRRAWELGATINLDDVSHWEYLLDAVGRDASFAGRTMCCRHTPESLRGGNGIIGRPEEAKFGMMREQLFKCYAAMKRRGVEDFGLHAMVVSNELDVSNIAQTARMLFDLAGELKERLGIRLSFVNIGGGIGVPYRPGEKPVDYAELSGLIREAYRECVEGKGLAPISLYMENGRCMTGPYGWLVTRVRHIKRTYRAYAGVDACMSNLMRPGMYGAYHHILVPGKEDSPRREVYDVVGSLCENNDKFAVRRELPELERGDLLAICDAGAHGHAMGFQYNGKLRSAELLLREDGTVEEIRRAETLDDYFATLPAGWRERLRGGAAGGANA